MVSSIEIRLDFFLWENIVPVEDILDMHHVDDKFTDSERYNARIWGHYIAWALKICGDNLNEVKNGFTWMKCFTQGCHKMAKAGILKIINGKTVQKCHALFRVEKIPLLIKEKRQLPYFLVANWGIAKAIHKCGQKSINKIQ